MWLVLCHPSDEAAIWAWRGLRALGRAPVRLVSAEMLVYGLRSRHWIGARGAGFTVELADGSELRSGEVRGVLNRIASLPQEHIHRAPEVDRSYAREEWSALLLSWLRSFDGPVVNPAHPLGFSGAWRADSEWALLAGMAGLPAEPFVGRSAEGLRTGRPIPAASVIVLGGRVFGTLLPTSVRDGCLRLHALAATPLLGIAVERSWETGEWAFRGATPLPDLRMGGDRLLLALARTFEAAAGETAA